MDVIYPGPIPGTWLFLNLSFNDSDEITHIKQLYTSWTCSHLRTLGRPQDSKHSEYYPDQAKPSRDVNSSDALVDARTA